MGRHRGTEWRHLTSDEKHALWKNGHPKVPKNYSPKGQKPFEEFSEYQKLRLWLLNDPRVPTSYKPPDTFDFYNLSPSIQSEAWRLNSPNLPKDFDIHDIPLSDLSESELKARKNHGQNSIPTPRLKSKPKVTSPALKEYFKNNPNVELSWRVPFADVKKPRSNYNIEYFPHGRGVIPEELDGLSGPEFYIALHRYLIAIEYEHYNHSTGNTLSKYVDSED